MLLRRLHHLLTAVLFLAAAHHCVVEDVSAWMFGAPAQNDMASGASGECPSHSTGDPGSHSEGSVCPESMLADITKLSSTHIAKLLALTALAIISTVIVSLLAPAAAITRRREAPESPPLISRLAHLLLIAPNAPPKSLA